MAALKFPVGHHDLHPDVNMNFQKNRWFGWVGEPEMLEEMRAEAARFATRPDWKREVVARAEHGLRQRLVLRVAFHCPSITTLNATTSVPP